MPHFECEDCEFKVKVPETDECMMAATRVEKGACARKRNLGEAMAAERQAMFELLQLGCLTNHVNVGGADGNRTHA